MPHPLKQPHALTAPRFPIDEVLPELRALLAANTRLVLEAPPGAGKTTQVPPALLDEAWLGGRRILMLEPRRIAARAAAEFMAAARGEKVGATVGYRIRHESKVSAATRIEVITEGILTRLLQDDPELPGVGAILFDEFHERHLHGDLGAALALDVQANLRPELRLVIMSATLDGERIARWFEAPRLSSAGRSFPVRIEHPPARQGEAWPERGWISQLRRAVEQALGESAGDVLVFLPGRREIERAREALAGDRRRSDRPAWRAGPGRAACRAGRRGTRHAARRPRHQRRRIEPDPARHPRRGRPRPRPRTALRSELGFLAPADGQHLASLGRPARRPRRAARPRRRRIACGRRAAGSMPRARPRSPRSSSRS